MEHSFRVGVNLKRYPVPAKEVRQEIVVVNSRFIASLAPAFTVEEARAFINHIKAEFADASHHVPVYLIGFGDSVIAHCSDAGEPSGTAGRPGLAVLQGSGLGDVVVVVTRYFGGSKLGTGGLVHAYSDAVRGVLEIVPKAERVPTHTVMVVYLYNFVERVRLLVALHRGQILEEDFAGDVTLTARFPVEKLDGFQSQLSDLTGGKVKAEVIESGEVLIPINR